MARCENRVVSVKGNDHNEFGSGSWGSYSEDSEGFGLKVTCSLCARKNRTNIEREGAKSGQEQQAQKMVFLSPTQAFHQFVLGQSLWSGCLTLIEDA